MHGGALAIEIKRESAFLYVNEGPWTTVIEGAVQAFGRTSTPTVVVARDIAHAKIKERLDAGEPMPEYLRDYPVYYAGPAKTPEGYASGSFARRLLVAWMDTSISSKATADPWSCSPKATGPSK